MEEVVQWVASGQCVVYPTSTLPALGCIPEASALDTLFSIKNRASSMPVSIGVVDLEQASDIVEIPEDVPEILAAFPVGSLTIILRAHEKMDARLGGNKIAIRVIAHPTARALIELTGPLTATSANRSGEVPVVDCVTAAELLSTPESSVVGVEGVCEGGSPSTLIAWHTVCDSTESLNIEVVREGKISSRDVFSWWKRVT